MRDHLSKRKAFAVSRPSLRGRIAYPSHDHDFGEVFWVEKGEGIQVVNGLKQAMGPGDCYFIRPWDRHSFHTRGNRSFQIINIAFQWHHLGNLRERYFAGDNTVYGEGGSHPKHFKLGDGQLQWGREAFLFLFKSPRTAFPIERFLMNLFAELGAMSFRRDFLSPAAPVWLRRAWETIEANDKMLAGGVGAFCRLCGRSAEHVSREFRRHGGTTLSKSISNLRMAHAAALLAGTDREILEISAECGFESLSHFYACFRDTYGEPPRRYRLGSRGFTGLKSRDPFAASNRAAGIPLISTRMKNAEKARLKR